MKPAHLSALLFLLAACAATGAEPTRKATPKTPWPGRIESWGTLREALRDGQVQGRVAVADQVREDVYAVGALEGLRGEVTIADGEVWLSEVGEDGSVTTRTAATSAMATVLFAAEVPRWTSVTVKETVDPSVLDAFLAEYRFASATDEQGVGTGMSPLFFAALAGDTRALGALADVEGVDANAASRIELEWCRLCRTAESRIPQSNRTKCVSQVPVFLDRPI